ncbi:MAG: NADPH:quinone reductase and related Zn-dependent oxidoreductase [Rhodospirillaceae bacterium]|nr:MAG: NADPH:quinone reductase and related Zn-dependent oxidoreductase [Rhodospirillaceae bacterium]
MAQEEGVRVLILREENGAIVAGIERVPESSLPEGDVTVCVTHSTLNYKDGLILKGLGKLVRSYPHVPGVDFAGVVEHSASSLYQSGEEVILTGWRVGEWQWGGYATKARVRAEWLVPMPAGLDARRAMALGTAGFTAMLAVMALEAHGLLPVTGEILVTGASGGVGSVAVAVLARLGYRVVASTGRTGVHAYLHSLGATRLINRAELADTPRRPLQSEHWAGAVDSVGGTTLATVATQMRHGASIAVCGNTGGNDVPLSVIPCLLRGVNLLGIASVSVPLPQRQTAWERLARLLPVDVLDFMTRIEPLGRLPELADVILRGNVQGRTVIDVKA